MDMFCYDSTTAPSSIGTRVQTGSYRLLFPRLSERVWRLVICHAFSLALLLCIYKNAKTNK